MAEEEPNNGRSASPYHQKCFPPFCDSAGQMDKQAVSKMSRNDLEDRYIVYADENIALKRVIRDHERQIQRLQTALARQDSADKKGGAKVPASVHYDSARVDSLESQNKNLQAKVKVLKQQLMNHSYIHSKENRIAENKEKQRRENATPDFSFRDVGQTQSARESKQRSNKDESALKERIAVLEQLLETQKEKSKARIAKLEKELAAAGNKSGTSLNQKLSEHSKKVNDNVEMIRLKRLSQEQEAKITTLTDQYGAIDKELVKLREALKQANENAEELQRQLERERERLRDAQSHVTKSMSHTETIRVLEEQVRDLQNERKTLKETNEQLLLLTSGTQSKSERSLQVTFDSLPKKSSSTTKECKSLKEENERLEKRLAEASKQLEKLKQIAAEHEYCQRPMLSAPPSTTVSEHKITPVTSTTDWSKTASSHEVQEVPVSEPVQNPVLVIVSKHEFDAVLLKKKKYHSETEVALPTHGQQPLNCKLEICVYDLEMDNQMMDYLSDMTRNPQVFVVWSFVGLEQRTLSMPADQAHFHTNVTYFGPLSDNFNENVKERDMPFYLMLEMSDGKEIKVGEGHLDLSPAIQQPARGFLRCVNLSGDRGSSTVYCSFKLHDCCQSEAPVSQTNAAQMLEVGIGHLRLKSSEIPSSPQATHLYIEYLLLGHCGEELETDSVPKAEVMRFNHTKRMRITDQDCVHLEPYLQKDNPKTLRFNVLAEPCSLASDSEVKEVGYADLNLLEQMVLKDQDVISAQLPVFDNDGQQLGSLSVTVIGIETIHNCKEHKDES